MKDKIILFVCKGNSGRSQMAEAFFNHFSKSGRAISAGTEADEAIHPQTIKVMEEVGIDVSRQKPKPLTDELMVKANKIIVMDSELLGNIPQDCLSKVETWQTGKLLGRSIGQVKEIRDEIKEKVEQFLHG